MKEGIVPDLTALSDHSETESDVAITTDESILESSGSVKDHQEKEFIGEIQVKQNETSSVKKRRLSLHNSNMEMKTDVVKTSRSSIVLGLAAYSQCPRRKPKNRGSR